MADKEPRSGVAVKMRALLPIQRALSAVFETGIDEDSMISLGVHGENRWSNVQ